MKEITALPPHCYPLPTSADITKLLSDVEVLLSRLGLNLNEVNQRCKTVSGFAINLTHLPGLHGEDRWKKYSGSHPSVREQGVAELDFTEHLTEIQDLYLGKLIHEIYNQHGKKFQGRAQLIWLGSNCNYNFHRDSHTPHRYHVPLLTNEKCFWLLKKSNIVFKLHMPADGRIWYLDPIGVEHTFYNQSENPRLHLLLTSGI
jgi:hypothetical protein